MGVASARSFVFRGAGDAGGLRTADRGQGQVWIRDSGGRPPPPRHSAAASRGRGPSTAAGRGPGAGRAGRRRADAAGRGRVDRHDRAGQGATPERRARPPAGPTNPPGAPWRWTLATPPGTLPAWTTRGCATSTASHRPGRPRRPAVAPPCPGGLPGGLPSR